MYDQLIIICYLLHSLEIPLLLASLSHPRSYAFSFPSLNGNSRIWDMQANKSRIKKKRGEFFTVHRLVIKNSIYVIYVLEHQVHLWCVLKVLVQSINGCSIIRALKGGNQT